MPTDRARELVRGGYDLHIHVAPDVPARIVDDVTLAHRFAEVGLAGFGLKSHYTSTAERAQIVSGLVPGVRAIGTITLNWAVGGMNALAVEIAAREGAKIVWLPTVDSPAETAGRTEPKPGDKVPLWAKLQHELRGLGFSVEPVLVRADDGSLLPETRAVLRAIARHGLILATGHLGREDIFAVVDGALEEGVETIVVTHPEFPAQNFSIEEQVALAEKGCLLERCLSTPHSGKTTFEHVFDGVRATERAQLLLQRLRQPGLPRGRGRARALGRPPARCGVRRGRDPRDGRRAVPAAGGRLVSRRMLVVGAHSADFVWRAGGAIAVTTAAGGTAHVLALSYGEQGESGELWKEPGMTVERVKEVRAGEAERAAAALGATFECLDLGDYPLEVDRAGLVALAARIRDVRAGPAAHSHRPRSVQPGSRGGVRRGRAGARPGRRRRDRERLRRSVPAARAPALRAAPAGALQLHADGLPRHHGA